MNQNERELKQTEVAGKLRAMREKQFQLSDAVLKGQKLPVVQALGEEVKTLTDQAIKSYAELVG